MRPDEPPVPVPEGVRAGTPGVVGEPERRSRVIRVAVRAVIGCAVIAILLVRSDVGDIASAVGNAHAGLLLAGLALLSAALVVGAFRWRAFLGPLGLSLPVGTLLRLYFVGVFFNAFLPTGVGGDAYKAMRLRSGTTPLAATLASVFLDRLAGVVALAVIGLVGSVSELARNGDDRVPLAAAILSILCLGVAVGLFLLGPRLRDASERGAGGIRQRLARLAGAAVMGSRDRGALAVGLAVSLAVQGLILASQVSVARALSVDVPVGALAGIVVLATLATAIPLSINGLGFREGIYVWSLGAYGVGHAHALAFALLVLALLVVTSAVGGLVYVAAGGEVATPSPAPNDEQTPTPSRGGPGEEHIP